MIAYCLMWLDDDYSAAAPCAYYCCDTTLDDAFWTIVEPPVGYVVDMFDEWSPMFCFT